MDRKKQIDLWVAELRKTFRVRSIDYQLMEKLFNERQYAKMISEMKNHMGIVCQISLKCITSPPVIKSKYVPAWSKIPEIFPPYGSQAQQNTKVVIFFYKEEMRSYHHFMVMMSHELSHIILYSLNHRLKMSEEATDILAMIMGFGHSYELGHTTFNYRFGYSTCGYLSFEEMIYALSLIEKG